MACSSGRQPNFVMLNRGRHLCLAGRPSRWALAHISSYNCQTTLPVLRIVTDQVVWSVTLVSPAKMAEPIEMSFGLRTWVGTGNHALDGVQMPHGKGNFEGERGVPL